MIGVHLTLAILLAFAMQTLAVAILIGATGMIQ
jgi:hypothetical protein